MKYHTLTLKSGEVEYQHQVEHGANLRKTLLALGYSPYTNITRKLNCGGRGLCATCGIQLFTERPPTQWHDRLAAKYRYPRLSCQITMVSDLSIALIPDKVIWGKRLQFK